MEQNLYPFSVAPFLSKPGHYDSCRRRTHGFFGPAPCPCPASAEADQVQGTIILDEGRLPKFLCTHRNKLLIAKHFTPCTIPVKASCLCNLAEQENGQPWQGRP